MVLVAVLASMLPGAATAEEETLPNLVARRPNFIQIGPADDADGVGIALRFSVRTANDGAYPLDVVGLPETLSSEEVEAQQCIVWIVRVCTHRETVGTLVWHAAHQHWHFNDFAVYELRRLTESGDPDMSEAGLVSGGRKTSYCLEDTGFDRSQTEVPTYMGTCSPVRQGISASWYDEYGWYLEGQQVPIVGVPDGDYALVITVNNDHSIRETTYADNVSFERLSIVRDDDGLHVVCESDLACESTAVPGE